MDSHGISLLKTCTGSFGFFDFISLVGLWRQDIATIGDLPKHSVLGDLLTTVQIHAIIML